MRNLCIIPARGGSKRIPRKNIRNFCGKPIIAYSIEAALQSNLFEEVMVSTDDEEIAQWAARYGATIPFLRSAQNSNDYANTVDVLLEVLNRYKETGKHYSFVCCCYPTAPFVLPQHLSEGYDRLIKKNAAAVFPVVEFSYPIQRSLEMDSENAVSMKWPEFMHTRSQDLQKSFHDAGQWYWLNVKTLLEQQKILSDQAYGYLLDPMYVQDIDNESDWQLAEMIYEFIQSTA